MGRKTLLHFTGCILFATVCSGCIYANEHCDRIETECWDVVDVYCDAWGCWEDWYTECVDYCVNDPDPIVTPECVEDYHCYDHEVCRSGRCIPADESNLESGLCGPCDVNDDCVEAGALCLNLTEDAEIGYCGRACTTNSQCPSGYECLEIAEASAKQCVPLIENGIRACEDDNLPPGQCDDTNPCRAPQVCDDGRCVEPLTPECTGNEHCGPDEECVDGVCQALPIECYLNSDCDDGTCIDGHCRTTCTETDPCPTGQTCQGGICIPSEPECQTGRDCEGEGPFYCVDGTCRNACDNHDDCEFGYYCRGFYCEVDPDIECRSDVECLLDERCVEGECFVECNDGCDCPAGLSCNEDGLCFDLDPPASCDDDCDCPGGYTCTDNACLAPEA